MMQEKWGDHCTHSPGRATLETSEGPSPTWGGRALSHHLPLFQQQKQKGLELCEEKGSGVTDVTIHSSLQ